MGKLAKILSGVQAIKQGFKAIKQPKIKPKKASDLLKKNRTVGMVGKKLKNTKPFTVRGINIGSKSRLGKGDVKVEDLSTIVDVKLPKEPAILRKTPSSFVARRMMLGGLRKKKK